MPRAVAATVAALVLSAGCTAAGQPAPPPPTTPRTVSTASQLTHPQLPAAGIVAAKRDRDTDFVNGEPDGEPYWELLIADRDGLTRWHKVPEWAWQCSIQAGAWRWPITQKELCGGR